MTWTHTWLQTNSSSCIKRKWCNPKDFSDELLEHEKTSERRKDLTDIEDIGNGIELMFKAMMLLCRTFDGLHPTQTKLAGQVAVRVAETSFQAIRGGWRMWVKLIEWIRNDDYYATEPGRVTLQTLIETTKFQKNEGMAPPMLASLWRRDLRPCLERPHVVYGADTVLKKNRTLFNDLASRGQIPRSTLDAVVVPPTPSPSHPVKAKDPSDKEKTRKKIKVVDDSGSTSAAKTTTNQDEASATSSSLSSTMDDNKRFGELVKRIKSRESASTVKPIAKQDEKSDTSSSLPLAVITKAQMLLLEDKPDVSAVAATSVTTTTSVSPDESNAQRPCVTTPVSVSIVTRQAPGAPGRPPRELHMVVENFQDRGYLAFQRDPGITEQGHTNVILWVALQLRHWRMRVPSGLDDTSDVDPATNRVIKQHRRWRAMDSLCTDCKYRLFTAFNQMENAATVSTQLCKIAVDACVDMLNTYTMCPKCGDSSAFTGLRRVLHDAYDYCSEMNTRACRETADAMEYLDGKDDF